MKRPHPRERRTNVARPSRPNAPRPQAGNGAGTLQSWSERGDAACQLLLVALVVATPLIPSESVIQQGTGAVLVMLWFLVLAGWFVCRLLSGNGAIRVGWTSVALLVFLAVHTISGIVAMQDGNARYALNSLWQWLTFGVLFFLTRQTLRTPTAIRAMVAVMLALAVTLSSHGLYQYAVELPANRAAFERDPEGTLRLTGIDAPPGSPARQQLVDRIYSLEPMATFALTNSLAGFLAPLLVLAGGIGLTNWWKLKSDLRFLSGLVLVSLTLAACLLLTKSRTAMLALAGGVVLLLAMAGLRRDRSRPLSQTQISQTRLSLPLLGALAVAAVLLLVGVIAVGGLDLQVLSEAPKSVLYRLEYWQATARMIARQPVFGCGPGNFQAAYSAFKLPRASETITDPHNCLLEVWATAGTPALLAFLAVGAAFLFQLLAARPADEKTGNDEKTGIEKRAGQQKAGKRGPAKTSREIWWIYTGGAAGVLLAYPCGSLVGFPVHILIVPLAFSAGALTLVLLHGWTREGQLPLAPLLGALAVLVINLLAAGGIGFPGVADSGWLLAALALNVLPACPAWSPSRRILGTMALGIGGLIGLCLLTLYSPVLNGQAKLAMGHSLLMRGRAESAAFAYLDAANADPYDNTAWLHLAQLYHRMALADNIDIFWPEFEHAVREATRRDPRSNSLRTRVGNWYLAAYEESSDPKLLESARAAFQQAVNRYPQGSMEHARCAWASYLAGDLESARAEAAEALRLDKLNPHAERKLSARSFPADWNTGSEGHRMSVEQRMQQLRRGDRGR